MNCHHARINICAVCDLTQIKLIKKKPNIEFDYLNLVYRSKYSKVALI